MQSTPRRSSTYNFYFAETLPSTEDPIRTDSSTIVHPAPQRTLRCGPSQVPLLYSVLCQFRVVAPIIISCAWRRASSGCRADLCSPRAERDAALEQGSCRGRALNSGRHAGEFVNRGLSPGCSCCSERARCAANLGVARARLYAVGPTVGPSSPSLSRLSWRSHSSETGSARLDVDAVSWPHSGRRSWFMPRIAGILLLLILGVIVTSERFDGEAGRALNIDSVAPTSCRGPGT